MDTNETTTTKEPSIGVGLKLFGFLSKIDTQKVSLIILILLSLQVLFGILVRSSSQYDLVALYFGKTILIRFLGYIGLVNALIDFYCRVFIHRERAIKWTFLKRPWIGLFTILLLWALLSIGVAEDKSLAFFGYPYRYEGYLSYLAYAGIFVSAAQIRNEKYRKLLLIITSVTSTLLAVLTLLKEIFGWSFLMYRGGMVGEYSATFINSNHYGYYLCVSMIVIAGLFMMVEKLPWKIVCGVCFTINLIVMLYNRSLGPYIAIAVGLVVFFIFNWIRKGFKNTWPILILVVIFIVCSIFIDGHKMIDDFALIIKQTTNVIDVIGSGGANTQEGQQAIDTIGSSRGVLWKNTIKTMLEHPIIGVGADNIQNYINNQIPHNEYLQVGANLGIPGLIIYLAALITCFAYMIKNTKKISDGTLIVGLGAFVYCVSAVFGISIPVATYQLFLFLGLLVGWFKHRDDERMNKEELKMLQNEGEPRIESADSSSIEETT
ncbi:MAG: O-antigen ligase family protein [Clostridiales bacterium]|nr:O-antigen ligase family protein [Clostridiales bacterium]